MDRIAEDIRRVMDEIRGPGPQETGKTGNEQGSEDTTETGGAGKGKGPEGTQMEPGNEGEAQEDQDYTKITPAAQVHNGEPSQESTAVPPAPHRIRLGRPRRYQSAGEFLVDAEKYFMTCCNEKGELIKPITITGLCNFLGTTRKQLIEWENGSDIALLKEADGDDEPFRNAIKRVKSICEEYAETHMFSARNPAGAIFALKNYGWRDIQTVETQQTNTYTVDPATRELLQGYLSALAQGQKRSAIDITPGRRAIPASVHNPVENTGYQQDGGQDQS